ncbi:DUF4139 domain-containing protein [Dethiosulfovibrio salsuginis]|uniref:DUF4139 domain-containing protein n=1 Tax=Dethiosulfovibrio salsuginis TaxID=561720 RepID=A0A1X7JND1_9BACT|nr:DUF4139 domain-containing protein [Dethiosulfovibrio salsuginis]SMG28949.1 conserved hypothetical protein [Dethiosulfovibrio salsuginis]
MKITVLFAVLVLCSTFLSPSRLLASEPSVTEASIYLDQAVLAIPMVEGESPTLDLPGTIDPRSIRLESSGEKVILGSSVEEIPRSLWIPPSLASIAQERDRIKRAFSEKQGIVQSLEQTLKALDELKPEVSPSEIASYAANFMEVRGDTTKKLVEEKESLEKLNREFRDLQESLEGKMPPTEGVMTRVSAATSGKGGLSIRCTTSHAGWRPSYRMNLDLEGGKLTAHLNGTVWQKTGLTFSGKLALHMGRPSSFSDPVKLQPLTVSLIDPSENKSSYRGETRLAAPAMMMESSITQALDVAVEESLTDRAFSFQGDIRGDGVPSTVLLEKWSTEVKPSMVAVPSMSPTLWLLAEGKMPEAQTIPANGEMYVDGKFSGRGFIPKLVGGQTFSIPFGEIPGVQIEREDKIPQSGSTWIGKGTLRRGYTITATNGLTRSIAIKVKDRIPVPTNERISVSLSTVDPSPSETDQETGISSWNLSLEPGESKEIHVIYDIRYPSDKELRFSR